MSLDYSVTYDYEPYRVPFFGSPFLGTQERCQSIKKTFRKYMIHFLHVSFASFPPHSYSLSSPIGSLGADRLLAYSVIPAAILSGNPVLTAWETISPIESFGDDGCGVQM